MVRFWPWFFKGVTGCPPGFRSLLTWWILADIAVGMICATRLNVSAFEFSTKALFPSASILVSMAIAWSNRATTVLQDKDFKKKIISKKNPIEDYLYGFQLSMLMMIATVVYLAVMSAGGFNFYIVSPAFSMFASSFFMYFLISFSLRECWSVMNFGSLLSLLHDKVSEKDQ